MGVGTLIKKSGETRDVQYVIEKLASGGELYNYIASPIKKLTASQARYFFKQLLAGMDFCHKIGIVHRDLKPENILLDENFNLMIADFGLLGLISSNPLESKVGTEAYWAPELHKENPQYDGVSIDIFAAGIILMCMVGPPPFRKAVANDPFFKHLIANNADEFWS